MVASARANSLNKKLPRRFSRYPLHLFYARFESVVTRMDTPKYGETLKFMYVKYQLILVVLPKVYQVKIMV